MIDFNDATQALIQKFDREHADYIEQDDAPLPDGWLEEQVPEHLSDILMLQGVAYADTPADKREALEQALIAQAKAGILQVYERGHEAWLARGRRVMLVMLNEDEPTLLYRKFPEQSSPQPVFLEIDSVSAEWGYVPEPQAPIPARVWTGRAWRVYLADGVVPTARAANRLMKAYEREIRRIATGIVEVYVKGEYRGELTEGGKLAASVLEEDLTSPDALCARDQVALYEPKDWFKDNPPVVKCEWPDERILEIAKGLSDKLPENVVLPNLVEYLYEIRGAGRSTMSVGEASKRWGMNLVSVYKACEANRVSGAYKEGGGWRIPLYAQRPTDRRAFNKGYRIDHWAKRKAALAGDDSVDYIREGLHMKRAREKQERAKAEAEAAAQGAEKEVGTHLALNCKETQVNERHSEDTETRPEVPFRSSSDE